MTTQNLLQIDRSKPFDPVTLTDLIGVGWSIVEEDESLLVLTEVDLTKVTLETMLRPGETRIQGEEKLRRLKDLGHIRLDARVFQHLWENQHMIPVAWRSKGDVFFDSTIFRGSAGGRYVLFLTWRGGRWYGSLNWLGENLNAECFSACLAG